MVDAVPSAPGPLPDRLDRRFALGELVGRGTCSEVYRAHDLLLDRDAAVKIFPVGDDPRIQREVSLMASLDHPSLVPVYDVGEVGGRAFVVMALLDGGNLADRLTDGPLGVTETLLAVASVADGLAAVHRAGVLHRDVTPRNVLFDGDGRAHLSDFGVALVADAPRITDTGIVVGSAPYLAPEQVRGAGVGPAADVYALGLVMIEALTARPAYDGSPLAAARARLERRPGIPDGLGDEVVALLGAMTADDPQSRPGADAVCVGLRRAALAAETVTPLHAVAPVAGVGLACAVGDAATDTFAGPGGTAAGTTAAAAVGMPSPVPAAPDLAPGVEETPRRTRRPVITEAGGLAVAASIVAAVLLAGGVVVASAWTVDSVSATAPPAASVAPPLPEVAVDPGHGAVVGVPQGGTAAHADATPVGRATADDAVARPATSRSDRGEGTAPSRHSAAPVADGGAVRSSSPAPSSSPDTSPSDTSAPPSGSPAPGDGAPTLLPGVPLPPLPLPDLPLPTRSDTGDTDAGEGEPGETSTPTPTSTTPASTTPASTTPASTTPASTAPASTPAEQDDDAGSAAPSSSLVEALGGVVSGRG